MGTEASTLVRDLIRFLTSSVLMSQNTRDGVLTTAFYGTTLHPQIDLEGPPAVFVPKLVKCMAAFGDVTHGKHSAVVLLETMRTHVGIDIQAEIDALCSRIKDVRDLRSVESADSRGVSEFSAIEHEPSARVGQGIGLPSGNPLGNPEIVRTGEAFVAVFLQHRIVISTYEPLYMLSQSDVIEVFDQGVEQGRTIEKHALLLSQSLEDHASVEQDANRYTKTIQSDLDDFDTAQAFVAARDLESILNQKERFLRPETLSFGFELLAKVEILKHKAAGETGDRTAIARAREFISRARDATQPKS